jgi:cytochrome oxidase assembly protein ShyY1
VTADVPVETHAPRTRRQWVTLGVAAVLLAVLCLVAARWQWHRYDEREAQIDLVEANYSAAPVPVDELLPGAGARLADDDVWRPAVLEGRYLPEETVLLRNRPVHGTPGFHVLVPFEAELANGEEIVLVVDRGFVPLGDDASSPESVPDPPAGEVRAVVTMRADEPPSDRGAPDRQVQAINTRQVLAAGAAWAEDRTVGAYGQLRSEDPAPAVSPGTLPPPDTDPGSHLSYTFQWVVFALGAVTGYVLLWRRETRPVTVTAGELLEESELQPRRASRARRTSDEDYEDALLDGGPQARDTSSA